MSDPICFKSLSPNFGDNVLVWETQVSLVNDTNQPVFFHQVQDGLKMCFTIQSLLQAFAKNKFKSGTRGTDGQPFRIVAYKDLVRGMKLLMLNDPILRQVCEPVSLEELDTIKSYLPAMAEILAKEEGAALAANQVGITKRFFLMKDKTLMINPELVQLWELVPFQEGCLSIPGTFADTERFSRITVRYKDENFNDVEKEFKGVEAIAIQHEVDHLDGKLYIDQLKPLRKQMVVDKHRKFLKMKGRM